MRHYFDSDLFGEDGLMQRRANPFGWQQRPQRPRASQPMRQPKPVPGPTSYGGVNQRAMQEAEGSSGYFDPQPTDSDIMGGEIDPEVGGALEAANSEYFAPRSQVAADDQIMGGQVDPAIARMAEDPYFGKPYNEDKDPPGHQKVAAAPEHVKSATGRYADAIRGHRATFDEEMDAINKTKRGFFKSRADFQAEQSQRIANAQAKFQGAVNAENAVLNAEAPEVFGKRTPEKHDWRHDNAGNMYDAAASTPTVATGVLPVKPDLRAGLDERRVANDEERIRLQAKRDADTAAYHDKWIGLQQAVIGARSAGDKAQAEARAGREIDRDIIKLEADKLKAVADAQFSPDKGASIAKGYDDLIEKARGMRGQDAPTTSAPPPLKGSGSDGPVARADKPATAEGGAGIPTTYKGKRGKKYKNPDGSWRFVEGA